MQSGVVLYDQVGNGVETTLDLRGFTAGSRGRRGTAGGLERSAESRAVLDTGRDAGTVLLTDFDFLDCRFGEIRRGVARGFSGR